MEYEPLAQFFNPSALLMAILVAGVLPSVEHGQA